MAEKPMTEREARRWAALLCSRVTADQGTAAFMALQEAVNGQKRGVICMGAAMLLAQQIAAHEGSMVPQFRAAVIALIDDFTAMAIKDKTQPT